MRSVTAVILDFRLVLFEPRLKPLGSRAGEILGWSGRRDQGWVAAPIDRNVSEVFLVETMYGRHRLRTVRDEAGHGRTDQSGQVAVSGIGRPPGVVPGWCGVSELRRRG